jgi:hypothetical protein
MLLYSLRRKTLFTEFKKLAVVYPQTALQCDIWPKLGGSGREQWDDVGHGVEQSVRRRFRKYQGNSYDLRINIANCEEAHVI